MGSSDHPADYSTIDILNRVQDAVAVATYIVANTRSKMTYQDRERVQGIQSSRLGAGADGRTQRTATLRLVMHAGVFRAGRSENHRTNR